jgi:hypothetical protein
MWCTSSLDWLPAATCAAQDETTVAHETASYSTFPTQRRAVNKPLLGSPKTVK